MHGCMDAWMHGCMDAWMHGRMDAWMHGCMDAWMHGCMDAWMHGCMDAWMQRDSMYNRNDKMKTTLIITFIKKKNCVAVVVINLYLLIACNRYHNSGDTQ